MKKNCKSYKTDKISQIYKASTCERYPPPPPHPINNQNPLLCQKKKNKLKLLPVSIT